MQSRYFTAVLSLYRFIPFKTHFFVNLFLLQSGYHVKMIHKTKTHRWLSMTFRILLLKGAFMLSRDCLQIRVLRNLISRGVKSSQISVLTPYSAQRAKISRALQAQMSSCDSEVLSVFASQGMYFCLPVNTTH